VIGQLWQPETVTVIQSGIFWPPWSNFRDHALCEILLVCRSVDVS
jgi:hypothetical protein